jgi:Tfp pilus assembly protein PilO
VKLPIKLPLDAAAGFLNSRTLREKQMFIGFFVIFVLTLDYFLLIHPVGLIFMESAPKLGELNKELEELRADRRDKDAIQKKWEETRNDLTQKEQAFIAPNEIPALLEGLSKEAFASGVKITSLKPLDMPRGKAEKDYSSLPIQMSGLAGTHELGNFLARLETGKTFFRVRDMKISANPSNERKHLVELSVESLRRQA